jgi:hypothetical protein
MLRKRPTGLALLSLCSLLALTAATHGPSFAQPLPGIILVDDAAAKPPVPLPGDADSVEYDQDAGSLQFNSATPPKQIADFYRDEMKKLGWKLEPTVINQDNMVNLEFNKDGKNLNFTMMKMGDHTMFQGEGEGLQSKSVANADQGSSSSSSSSVSSSASSDSNGASSGGPLTAEDSNGYPVPSEHSMLGSESSLFRKSINVTTHAQVQDLVAFYQDQLPKKGFTTISEHTAADNALLVYDTPNGPLSVSIKQEDSDNASATLSISDKTAASKSPLFPKPGQVKIGLGNINDKAAEVSVNGKKVKVPAGAGAKAPDGPTLDVAPGKIQVELKGAPPETIDAGPDQIWLVMVGPGGLLPIQAY